MNWHKEYKKIQYLKIEPNINLCLARVLELIFICAKIFTLKSEKLFPNYLKKITHLILIVSVSLCFLNIFEWQNF